MGHPRQHTANPTPRHSLSLHTTHQYQARLTLVQPHSIPLTINLVWTRTVALTQCLRHTGRRQKWGDHTASLVQAPRAITPQEMQDLLRVPKAKQDPTMMRRLERGRAGQIRSLGRIGRGMKHVRTITVTTTSQKSAGGEKIGNRCMMKLVLRRLTSHIQVMTIFCSSYICISYMIF